MNHNPKIELTDTTMSALMKMAEGNPGAITAMVDIIKNHQRIDPQAALGGIGAIMMMDTWGIYGSRIWMLYKDVCKNNVVHMLGLMRACQLGLLPESKLQHAIDNYGDGIDLNSLLASVKEQLAEFDKVQQETP